VSGIGNPDHSLTPRRVIHKLALLGSEPHFHEIRTIIFAMSRYWNWGTVRIKSLWMLVLGLELEKLLITNWAQLGDTLLMPTEKLKRRKGPEDKGEVNDVGHREAD
jgi:hypothetical protein